MRLLTSVTLHRLRLAWFATPRFPISIVIELGDARRHVSHSRNHVCRLHLASTLGGMIGPPFGDSLAILENAGLTIGAVEPLCHYAPSLIARTPSSFHSSPSTAGSVVGRLARMASPDAAATSIHASEPPTPRLKAPLSVA